MSANRNVVLIGARLAVVILFFAVQASAQIARVFLSGTGDDANDCSNATTPCRSLQAAITQAPADGEIIVLTSGGFGTANITKSLTINAPTGVVAFNARTITVTIADTDTVVIRGLSMNGALFGDAYGINYTHGGTLIVENSTIAGFSSAGIRSIFTSDTQRSALMVNNCEFRNNGGDGILSDAGISALAVQDSRFLNNANAGIQIFSTTYSTIKNSVISGNTFGIVANGITYSVCPFVVIDKCVIANNRGTVDAAGIRAQNPYVGFGSPIIRVTNSSIYGNNQGLATTANAVIVSYGNNRLWNNTTAGAFSSTMPEN